MKNATLFLTSCFWMMTAAHAQQLTDGPSIEDTITYINSHSAPRRDNYLVSASLDKSLLILQHTVPNMCGAGCDGIIFTTAPFRVISQLKADIGKKPDGTGEVWLHCPKYQTEDGFNYEKCMHFRLVTSHPSKPEDEHDQGGIEAVPFDDLDQANRLQHALTHLFTLLDQRYQQQIQQRDPNDPFKYRGVAMNINAGLLFLGLCTFATQTASPQEPVYVSSAESCVSISNKSGGGKAFENTCSRKIFASVYISTGLIFGGYYNSGHMSDLPPGTGRYSYFACPANAEPEDSDTRERVTFNTTSYKCRETGT